jgi:ribonuclease HI
VHWLQVACAGEKLPTEATNNVAEYKALIVGMEVSLRHPCWHPVNDYRGVV